MWVAIASLVGNLLPVPVIYFFARKFLIWGLDKKYIGGIVLCESETGIVLPAQAGSLTLQKQYKYGKVLLWKYTKPMQPAAEQEGEAL